MGVERCVRYAFELADGRVRKHCTLVHKTNVLTFAGDLWQRTFDEVATEYPHIATAYNHVDAACIYMVERPESYDVIVTDNLFGDILTDLAGAVAGGIGLAASANLNPARTGPSLFEPVHGSAPDIVGTDKAKIHILTHTLHYGCGVFEGIRAYKTKKGTAVFRLTDHITRLFNSAKIFFIDVPFTAADIVEATKLTVRENKLDECYIRPIVYLGYGEMGLNPLPAPVNVSIAVWPWGTYLGDEGLARGVTMKISSWQRHDPNAMPPAAKGTGMYINSSMAKIEALKGGYDEAILLSPQGYVSECTGENIFVVRNGTIITPPTSAGALEGITQSSVMTIARDLG